MKVLVNSALPSEQRERLRAGVGPGVSLVFVQGEEEARKEIADAEILFGRIMPGLLALASELRWVQPSGASQERHLFPEFIESDITLTNMAGIYNEHMADHVYALILALARQIHRLARNQRTGCWDLKARHEIESLNGKTLGLIGLGGIGGEVARRAPAFGLRVVATRANPDRRRPACVERVWGPDGLPELLAASDYVVISTPETPRTLKMIGREELRMMKPTAHIINVGRGAVVDLAALTRALEEGLIAGAGLDVMEMEPLPSDNPLWRMENVLITPHLAASPHDIYPARRVEVFLDNLCRYIAGRRLRNVVDKHDWH